MKRILLVADKRDWIFERHAREISARLPAFRFDIAYLGDPGLPASGGAFDLVYLFDPFWIDFPHHDNVIMGVRAEWLYRDHPGGVAGWYRQRVRGRCRMLHVLTRSQYEHLRPVVHEPLLRVPHGVDTAVFRPGPDRGARPFTIGIAGNRRSHNAKGIELVEEAGARLGLPVTVAEQDFAGGHRDKQQMADWFHGIDVYCCMSRTEGLCNPVLEAGACAVPVVSTPVGIVPEIIRDGENGLVIERSVDALVHALARLRDDRELRTRIAAGLHRTIVEDWSWDTRAFDYARMFEQFLALPAADGPAQWFRRLGLA